MDNKDKTISINEIDTKVAEHIKNVLINAIAKSLVNKAFKDVCGEKEN